MPYTGEQLWPGQLGHLLVLISFVASLVATISFFKTATLQNELEKQRWKRMARIAFMVEVLAVIGIFGMLYYIISRHLFEYKYAWQHSNLALPMQYILSCFWEGQEGSFLLWSFWHCILGVFIILRKDPWEAPVMTVISFMQFLLASMVVGIYFLDFKLGSSPFVLMRDEDMLSPDKFPIGFTPDGKLRTDYLSFIRDGNGLNPLLQNYWMTIHPPVLFLGFASTLVPFAYAIAGLWKKDFSGWIRYARPWALFSAGVLGLGIMMGAAWAYESLTFGGYSCHADLSAQRTFSSRDLFIFYSAVSVYCLFNFSYEKRYSGRYQRACVYGSGDEYAIAAIPVDLFCSLFIALCI
jgi:cytochrome c-type biogenesis protein CcmF